MYEDDERFIASTKSDIDEIIENSLRPSSLDDYVGQKKFKDSLSIYIKAAKARNEALDHVLLFGPPGLGKTTLSHIIANELGAQLKVTSGPAIEHAADLAAILTNLGKNDVLFIDEIHRLSRAVEEVLYPAMEDFALDFVVGKGPAAKSIRLKIQPFTLIGATTRAGMLTGPLRDRFGVLGRLELYNPQELSQILTRSANILNIEIDPEAALLVGQSSRGTPRIANRFLKRIRDYAQVKGFSKIDAKKLLTFEESSIDVMLPSLLIEFGTNCYVVNGMYPERVLSLIDDNINDYNFDYTLIIGD